MAKQRICEAPECATVITKDSAYTWGRFKSTDKRDSGSVNLGSRGNRSLVYVYSCSRPHYRIIREGLETEPTIGVPAKFADYCDMWITDIAPYRAQDGLPVRPKVLQVAQSKTAFWVSELGNVRVADIDATTINKSIRKLRQDKKLGADTLNVYRKYLRKIFVSARDAKLITHTRFLELFGDGSGSSRGQVPKQKDRGAGRKCQLAFKQDQRLRMREMKTDCRNGLYAWAAFQIGVNTGAREREIFALRWSDILPGIDDPQEVHIGRQVEETLENGERVISDFTKASMTEHTDRTPMVLNKPYMVRVFRQLKQFQREQQMRATVWNDNDLIFTDSDGGIVSVTPIIDVYRSEVKRLGIKWEQRDKTTEDGIALFSVKAPRFHQTKNTYVTTCIRDLGIPEAQVQDWAGHADVDMTQHYYDSTDTMPPETLSRMASLDEIEESKAS